MEVDPDEEPREEAHTSIYDGYPPDFGYFNMAHGMLVEISEEIRAKFPQEPRLRFSQLNNLHLAARNGQMLSFVEILNTISCRAVQTYLVNTVSTRQSAQAVDGTPICVIA
ncbi:hypothetical protein M5D96_010270 [Drosophila gunungcola]|uniref:Uncharacterized protein n=1 Tax=Drosophila gunungcola TaxID=103775 RepID=A0A9P9YHA1_9MUSC|nr:hypothetical protein M5D96_010270 [Drosophila gunungcola]